MKIKHSWKGSEQARIRKKEFALEVSNYPPSHPRYSPSGFSGPSVSFTHHPDSGTKGRQKSEEQGVGEGQNTPRNESKTHQKKTVCNEYVPRFRNHKKGVGSSNFSEDSRASQDTEP